MKLEMIKSLKSRFAGVEENRLLYIATILDPRFKDKFFASNIIKTTVKEMLDEEMQKIVDEDNSLLSREQSVASRSPTPPSPKRAKKDTLLTMYPEIIENSGASASASVDEVECYLGEPFVDYKNGNPFKWWGESKALFPILALLAKQFLSGTATSVPSEQLFSQAELCMKNIETGFYLKMLKPSVHQGKLCSVW